MNKKFTNEQLAQLLKKTGEGFKLSASDKGILKADILNVIKSSPVRINKWSKFPYSINSREPVMPLIPILIAALIALGGGTAALADSAKPGDFLYLVDQWVEKVQEKFAISDEAKATLLARFSEERLQELQDILATDPTQLATRARQLWEQHKEDAVNRVAASIERANAVKERFEEKLQGASEEDTAKFQKVIDTMDEIVARREQRMDTIQSKEFPGLGQVPLQQQIRQWAQENKDELKQIREQIKEEFSNPKPGQGADQQVNSSTGSGQSSVAPAIAYFPDRPDWRDMFQGSNGSVSQEDDGQQSESMMEQIIARMQGTWRGPYGIFDNPKFPPPPQLMTSS